MSQPKKQLTHYQKLQLSHVKYLNDQIKARQDKNYNLSFRKNLLEYQKRRNLSSEYERIRAHLADKHLSYQTHQNLNERITQLKKLGVSAFEIS